MRFSIIILLSISLSCKNRPALPEGLKEKSGDIKPAESQNPKPDEKETDKPESTDLAPLPLSFTTASIAQDSYDYTYGSLKIKSDVSLSKNYEIYLHDTKITSLMSSESDTLKDLCQAIGVVSEGQNTLLSWRSHYSVAVKRLLKNLMLQGHDAISCVVSWKAAPNKPAYFVIFDPIPSTEADILGTKSAKDALLEVVMSPQQLKTGEAWLPSNMEQVELDQTKSKLRSVKSIHASTVTLAVSAEQGDECILDSSDAKNPTFNKDQPKEFTYSFNALSPFALGAIRAIEAKDGMQKTCEEISMKAEKNALKSASKCETYTRLLAENKLAQCQWEVEFSNSADKENSVSKIITLAKIKPKTLNFLDWNSTRTFIPQNADNPIRKKKVQLVNMSAEETAFMAQLFDLIMHLLPEFYERDFKNTVRTLAKATADDKTCVAGAAGYTAGLNVDRINICPVVLKDLDLPKTSALRMQLIYHETRHAIGLKHDKDDLTLEPCMGTALSADVPIMYVSRCDDIFCKALRIYSPTASYIFQLNYSLNNDERRFQGLCQKWNKILGIDRDDF
ncbi:MAG: hypothetical protein EOP04_07275 [Proteobacteria bacterium]|nr:MAG: hypothetical protein EOP04_07275 [Pseudomonadota bacterium]